MTIQHFFLFRVGLRHQLEESHDTFISKMKKKVWRHGILNVK